MNRIISSLVLWLFSVPAFGAVTGLTAHPASVTYVASPSFSHGIVKTDSSPFIFANGSGSTSVSISTSGGTSGLVSAGVGSGCTGDSWLTAQLASGTVNGGSTVGFTVTVTASFFQTGPGVTCYLPLGTYTGTVTVSGAGFNATTTVTFTIYQGEDGTLTPFGKMFTAQAGGPSQTPFLVGVTLDGPGNLSTIGDPATLIHLTFDPGTPSSLFAAAIVNSSQFQVTVTPPASPGQFAGMVMVNGSDNGVPINLNFPVTVLVTPPAPVISGLSPSSMTAGGAAFTLTVNGSLFANGSTIQWNGSAVSTTFVNAGQLTASISATLIASAGSVSVTVVTTGAPASNAKTFTINPPTPVVSGLSPSSTAAGGAAFMLTVNGSGFVSGSTIQWNGSAVSTTLVNAGQLTAPISAAQIASAGSATVTVVTPGAPASNAMTFTINPTTPVISGLSPSSMTATGVAFMLTVNGSGFVSGSTVLWNGSAVPTTFVSAGQLTASISGALIASAGSAIVTVATTGSSASNAVMFVVGPLATLAAPAAITFTTGPNNAVSGPQLAQITASDNTSQIGFTAAASSPGNWLQVSANQSFTPAVLMMTMATVPQGSTAAITLHPANGAPDAVIQVTYAPPVPGFPAITEVVNAAASEVENQPIQQGIGSQAYITIRGSGLTTGATGFWTVNQNILPAMTLGSSIMVGGKPAYPYWVSPNQINAVAPSVAPGTVQVTVATSTGASNPFSMINSTYSPAFFLWPNNQVAATRNNDNSLAVKDGTFAGLTTAAAKPGDVLIFWATGFGPTNPSVADGVTVPFDPLTTYFSKQPVTVTLNNESCNVYGAAMAATFAGLYQVAVQVPLDMPNGDWPLTAKVNGVSTPAGVILSVHN